MATIVLKNVPAGLREQLELRARASGRSVEREVIACLESVVGTAPWDPGPEEALLARARKLRAEVAAAGGRPITNEEIDEAKRKGRQATLVTSDRQVLAAFPETAVSPEAFVAH